MKTIHLALLFAISAAGGILAQTPAPAATPTPIAAVSKKQSALSKDSAVSLKAVPKRGDDAALNPQPLPPKEDAIKKVVPRPGDDVALNPQPLPPKDDFNKSKVIRKNADDKALNPQPLPPKDDPRRLQRFVLSNGWNARVVGKNLMISGAKGETKAAAGNYKTREGRVIVVNMRGEIAN